MAVSATGVKMKWLCGDGGLCIIHELIVHSQLVPVAAVAAATAYVNSKRKLVEALMLLFV